MKVKRMLYYKELSKIINKSINVMQFCNRKHNGTIKYYCYRESDELIENLFDHGCISCDAYEYFKRRIYFGYRLQ